MPDFYCGNAWNDYKGFHVNNDFNMAANGVACYSTRSLNGAQAPNPLTLSAGSSYGKFYPAISTYGIKW